MKSTIILFFTLLLCSMPCGAQFRPKTYVCYRASGPIVVDGLLNEGSWLRAPSTDLFVDIEGDRMPPPWYGTRVKVLWDDEYLYVGAMLEDENVWGTLTEEDAPVYFDNDFEIFLDIDNDGRWYFEFEMNALNTVYDVLIARKGAWLDIDWDIEGILTAVHVDGTLNNPADTDRGWTCEIAWPMKSLAEQAGTMPVPPHDGDEWRIDFPRVELVMDEESKRLQRKPGTPVQNWVWSPPLVVNNHWIEALGFLRFSTDVVGAQDDTAVAASLRRPFLTIDTGKRKRVKPGDTVLVPGGEYTRGPDPTDENTSPARTVKVAPFRIDTCEVTVAEYAAFLNAVKKDEHYYRHMAHHDCGIVKKDDGGYEVLAGREEYPVVYVLPVDAEAYSAWAGKRLPTESEWEWACRFDDGRAYAWGDDEPDPALANYDYHYGGPAPVGSFPDGRTKKGIHDMSGNVWEICVNDRDVYPPDEGMRWTKADYTYRGGSWATPPKLMRAAVRQARVQRTPFIGFRCVTDVE